jgi:two-component system nitrogen regulation response regulator NtrX
VIPIVVPPLRERREDIPALVQPLRQALRRGAQPEAEALRPAAMEALQRYRWRGNIRELRNTVERLLIMTPATWSASTTSRATCASAPDGRRAAHSR